MSVPALHRPALSLVPDHAPVLAEARAVDADLYRSVFRRHAAGVVVINFLSADQHSIAGRFATSGIDRFAEPTRWSRLGTGEPVLDDAPSYLRAEVEHRVAVGDHYLVVARLATHTERREHEPLLYHDGRYAKAHHV